MKQTKSLEEYISAFKSKVSQIIDFSNAHYHRFFLGRLKKQLRAQIQDGVVGSYSAALQAARKLDHAATPTTSTYSSNCLVHELFSPTFSQFAYSFDSITWIVALVSTASVISQGSTTPRNPQNIRQISNDEYWKHRAIVFVAD